MSLQPHDQSDNEQIEKIINPTLDSVQEQVRNVCTLDIFSHQHVMHLVHYLDYH